MKYLFDLMEKFYSSITITMKDATFIGKAFYNFAISVGSKRKDYILNGEPVPFTTQLLFGFCDQFVLKNIKKLLGLNNCRYALSGAAPISPELIDWYLSIGLDMREGWGMTETAGIGTAFYSREIKKGCVGSSVMKLNFNISINPGKVVTEIENLSKNYGDNMVLSDINLLIERKR